MCNFEMLSDAKKQFCNAQYALYSFAMCNRVMSFNGIAGFKKCKQLFEYQQVLLLRDIW